MEYFGYFFFIITAGIIIYEIYEYAYQYFKDKTN